MAMRDRTREMFAQELEEMLKEMPLSKVRVSHLCERCGAAKPTFYYHFRDKYELVAWSFLRDYTYVAGGGADYTPELLGSMNARIEARRDFYQKCFEDRGQNNIGDYCTQFNLLIAEEAYAYAHDGAQMSPDQANAVRYHAHGVMGMFVDWLFNRSAMTSAEMSVFLFERTPDFLKEAFARYPYPADHILSMASKTTRRAREEGGTKG